MATDDSTVTKAEVDESIGELDAESREAEVRRAQIELMRNMREPKTPYNSATDLQALKAGVAPNSEAQQDALAAKLEALQAAQGGGSGE